MSRWIQWTSDGQPVEGPNEEDGTPPKSETGEE